MSVHGKKPPNDFQPLLRCRAGKFFGHQARPALQLIAFGHSTYQIDRWISVSGSSRISIAKFPWLGHSPQYLSSDIALPYPNHK